MEFLRSDSNGSTSRGARRGWVFFDGDCAFCTSFARRFRTLLGSRGYALAPLQEPRVQALLGVPVDQLLREMRVRTSDGKQFGGADALVILARSIWWAWPLYALGQVPGGRRVLRAGYRWLAARRNCSASTCARPGSRRNAASS